VPGVEERRVNPWRDLDLLVVVERAEVRQDCLGVVLRVQRRVEVDVDLRRLGPQLRLRVEPGGAA
jgi:hypothetical protein